MKSVRNKYLFCLLLVSFISLSLNNYSLAQWPNDPAEGVGSGDPGDPSFEADDPGDPGNDPDLPIDSNILVLVAAVVGYGLKKWWDVKHIKRKNGLQTTTANYEDYIK
jgi:hypothetical protein